jgi:hypothetical protein
MSERKIASELVSVEKPMPMLTTFDRDAEIAVKPHSKRSEAGRIPAALPDQRGGRLIELQSNRGRRRT